MATKKRKTKTKKPAAKKKKRKAKAKPKAKMPKVIYAQVSPRSIGGRSLFDAPMVSQNEVAAFTSDDGVMRNAVSQLQNAGFEVLQVGDCTINVAAPASVYEKAFGTKLYAEERMTMKSEGKEEMAGFIDSTDTDVPGLISATKSRMSNFIEGVAIEEPYYHFAANAFAPLKKYWHLRVPGDVSLGYNADKAHRAAITGKGIKVVMTDSGWFRHPYFVQRGYRASPVVLGPGAANPNADESGHGTAESANAFSVAPDIDFTMVKMSFVNTTGAFNAAVGLGPDIISCSWGASIRFGPLSPARQALAAAIAAAVARGIIVVFSAGNGHFGFPGQHPDVVSAGGTYLLADGSLRASNYSSGFASAIYAGRNVPDVCGLVGELPRAAYIMLPVEPGDQIDVGSSGGVHPNGDETARNDGWAAISGTSAAAPGIAGVCALIKQACPRLTPAQVRQILKDTARDVTAGNCNPATGGHAAGPGPDLATGHGLVDGHRAVLVAKLRCRPVIGPIQPVQPIQPIQPGPIRPIQPVQPIQPGPIRPIQPVQPIQPDPIRPQEQAGQLSDEDRAALERMIMEEDLTL